MNEEKNNKSDNQQVSTQLRGETMAYAAQSIFYNLGANFFEPYINYSVQKHYAGHEKIQRHGNYTQNLAGEFAGDIIGASTLMLAEAFASEQLHAATRAMRSRMHPFYASMAHRVFAKEKDDPNYDQKIAEWTTFHERNLVRSGIIAAAGIVGNVATQKMLIGNPSPTKLIIAGKLASTMLTTALGLTVRGAFPNHSQKMDSWIGKNVFAPMINNGDDPPESTHVERLENSSSANEQKGLS